MVVYLVCLVCRVWTSPLASRQNILPFQASTRLNVKGDIHDIKSFGNAETYHVACGAFVPDLK